jgi:hypothetical protein
MADAGETLDAEFLRLVQKRLSRLQTLDVEAMAGAMGDAVQRFLPGVISSKGSDCWVLYHVALTFAELAMQSGKRMTAGA